MRKRRLRIWVKLAVLMAVGASLGQASTCTTDINTLGQDLAISIADQLIGSFVADQFGVAGSNRRF